MFTDIPSWDVVLNCEAHIYKRIIVSKWDNSFGLKLPQRNSLALETKTDLFLSTCPQGSQMLL